jgi:hypothetical protein
MFCVKCSYCYAECLVFYVMLNVIFVSHADCHIIEQIALNKSSFLLKIQKQNIQLFTKIIKIECIYKSNLNAKPKGLGEETKGSN